MGSWIIPLSERFTRRTNAACCSGITFLCSTPTPPERAIAMAMLASVTVSIAAETSGMLTVMLRVMRERVEASRGITDERAGTSSTSS